MAADSMFMRFFTASSSCCGAPSACLQFFITLGKCEWLDKKNTIFGKVVGDTIYNLTRFNEIDVSHGICHADSRGPLRFF